MGLLRKNKGNNGSKNATKLKKAEIRKEKIDMYDMIVANLIAGNSIIEPSEHLDASQIAIGFSNISSENYITKYFIIRQFPDYLRPQLIDNIRSKCITKGVKINFYLYSEPYKINWDSQEMKNKLSIWKEYSQKNGNNVDVFNYREKRGEALAKERITLSTKYLNEAELDHKRSLLRTTFVISVSAPRNDDAIINMGETINRLKQLCSSSDIKLRELRVNMIDWLNALNIFSLKRSPEITNKLSKKVVTDDILSNFNSYKQGRVGLHGVPLGIDVLSGSPVLRKFKENPDKAENWLISAETGGGKSYFIKSLLTYLLADGYVVTVMDYEGDEYSNLAAFIKAGKQEDVSVISLGRGSSVYFDPCVIPDLTGDNEVDDDLKSNALNYITAIFRIITHGINGDLSKSEEKVLSSAIARMYDSAGVTDKKETWHRSKELRLHMIYEEIKMMVESKELVESGTDNEKHEAAVKMLEASALYFEPGESKASTFGEAMSADELFKSKFIVFSFGMKGAAASLNDPTTIALKQLSVAYVGIQISNHCKYVKKGFNVKIWEEYQRWGELEGSSDIIGNTITGGRKRGDINFIVTNDLSEILNDDNKINEKIRQNIQNYAVGKIADKGVRRKFCDKFDLQDVEIALDRIAKATTTEEKGLASRSASTNRYQNAFCVVLDNGKKATVKVHLPKSISESSLFRTGVDIQEEEDDKK